MPTLEKLLRVRAGVKLFEMTVHNGPFITHQSYAVTSPRSRVAMNFPDLREAERAWRKAVTFIEDDQSPSGGDQEIRDSDSTPD
ncbi:hypothetical protein [Sphingomonas colocasiae]|uniref:Uncharacterized protein n=1 Tax=Sphingomonas colocasiae TaxID=1848973 RepID=A0ABS7PRG4_9SPHN|nr:hypothetical protein [Sphingomonas colocasiae]MBY8823851.1 hypothetical protein [Sphingomonas colocasiae]